MIMMPVILKTVVTYILIQLRLLIIIEAGVKFNRTGILDKPAAACKNLERFDQLGQIVRRLIDQAGNGVIGKLILREGLQELLQVILSCQGVEPDAKGLWRDNHRHPVM